MLRRFDYVIVGAGLAGCVLANRLTRNGRFHVLLLAGGKDLINLGVQASNRASLDFANKDAFTMYSTEQEPYLFNRKIGSSHGKLHGGVGPFNELLYLRGNRYDYDQWCSGGSLGWSWDDVLPYFRMAEANDQFLDQYHGLYGRLCVSSSHYVAPVADAFLKAGVSVGLTRNDDFNGPNQEGVGAYQFMGHSGTRYSTTRAYLQPAIGRSNLCIVDNAICTKLLTETGQVVGVQFRRNDMLENVYARQTLLTAGTVKSPQILMVSGIGPGQHLAKHGIPVVRDLPGVGCNLQDHLSVDIGFRVHDRELLTLSRLDYRNYLSQILQLLVWAARLSVVTPQVGAFIRTNVAAPAPDIQISFFTKGFVLNPKRQPRMLRCSSVQCASTLLRPESRGSVRLRSANSATEPEIRGNYLSSPSDVETLMRGLRWMRRIANEEPLRGLIAKESSPGSEFKRDEQITDYIRATAKSMMHLVGTCAMGKGDLAVVDDHLRVHGVSGIRVIDASIMPTIISGNIDTATIMIAERAADLIIGDATCS